MCIVHMKYRLIYTYVIAYKEILYLKGAFIFMTNILSSGITSDTNNCTTQLKNIINASI